jgi:hypothetical protein
LKAHQKMLRDGYAAVTRRAKIARRQIGSALAPHWLPNILNGWEWQIKPKLRQTLDDAHGTITPCARTTKEDSHNQREKKVA